MRERIKKIEHQFNLEYKAWQPWQRNCFRLAFLDCSSPIGSYIEQKDVDVVFQQEGPNVLFVHGDNHLFAPVPIVDRYGVTREYIGVIITSPNNPEKQWNTQQNLSSIVNEAYSEKRFNDVDAWFLTIDWDGIQELESRTLRIIQEQATSNTWGDFESAKNTLPINSSNLIYDAEQLPIWKGVVPSEPLAAKRISRPQSPHKVLQIEDMLKLQLTETGWKGLAKQYSRLLLGETNLDMDIQTTESSPQFVDLFRQNVDLFLTKLVKYNMQPHTYFPRVTFSDFETKIPQIYREVGLLSKDLKEQKYTEALEIKAMQGTILHLFDSLFALVASGQTGENVNTALPTVKDSERKSFCKATENIKPLEKDENKIRTALNLAYQNFRKNYEPNNNTFTLFPELVPNLTLLNKTWNSRDIDIAAHQLMEGWVKDIVNNYEEIVGVPILCEVMIIVNIDCGCIGIQVPCRVDLMRLHKEGVAIYDLKTGSNSLDDLDPEDENNWTKIEIDQRQKQQMVWITRAFIKGNFEDGQIIPPKEDGKAYVITKGFKESQLKPIKNQASLALRRLNRKEARIEEEAVELDLRTTTFYKWLKPFVLGIHFLDPQKLQKLRNGGYEV